VIFLTVGHQMPFDRLVAAVDDWVEESGRLDVFAQIGSGSYAPRNFASVATLSPADFAQHVADASGIVAHAGTGTIIAALRRQTPLLVLPRRASLGETRNDHQLATADYFEKAGYLMAVRETADLAPALERLESFQPSATIQGAASPELLHRLREFAFGTATRESGRSQ
jgi:UDP-N-acetylglucosamine transferase subunit ALG13